MSGKDDLLRMVRHAAASAEDALDIARRRLWKRTGRHRPRYIAAYQGWADPKSVHLCGRVLANRPGGGPRDEDNVWQNLLNTYRRWETDEVADTAVTMTMVSARRTVTAPSASLASLPVSNWMSPPGRLAVMLWIAMG